MVGHSYKNLLLAFRLEMESRLQKRSLLDGLGIPCLQTEEGGKTRGAQTWYHGRVPSSHFLLLASHERLSVSVQDVYSDDRGIHCWYDCADDGDHDVQERLGVPVQDVYSNDRGMYCWYACAEDGDHDVQVRAGLEYLEERQETIPASGNLTVPCHYQGSSLGNLVDPSWKEMVDVAFPYGMEM